MYPSNSPLAMFDAAAKGEKPLSRAHVAGGAAHAGWRIKTYHND